MAEPMDITSLHLWSLPCVPLHAKSSLPALQGVYFVLGGAIEVLYIGKTRNLYQRWNVGRHHKFHSLSAFPEAYIAWLLLEEFSQLGVVEEQCIRHFNPRFNAASRLDMPRPREEFATMSVSGIPVSLRNRAKSKAFMMGISLQDFVIQALEEKIASSS